VVPVWIASDKKEVANPNRNPNPNPNPYSNPNLNPNPSSNPNPDPNPKVGARTIRKKITEKLPQYLTDFPPLPAAPSPHPSASLRAECAKPVDWAAIDASLTVDRSVAEVDWCVHRVGRRGGAAARCYMHMHMHATWVCSLACMHGAAASATRTTAGACRARRRGWRRPRSSAHRASSSSLTSATTPTRASTSHTAAAWVPTVAA